MRGRVTSVLFSLLFIASTAVPDCNFQRIYSGQYRSTYFDLAVDGDDLWAATGYGLSAIDRNSGQLRPISSIAIPGLTKLVRASGGVAYAGSGSAIYVVRRNGKSLQLVRTIDAGGTVNDLLLSGSTLLAATSNGIVPFDLSNPLAPTKGASFDAGRNILSIAQSASLVFAADGDNTIDVFSRSGYVPAAAISSLPRSTSVRVAGERLLVSDGQQTEVFAVTGAPLRIATFAFGSTSAAALTNNVVFLAGNDRQLHALDVSLGEDPVELFSTELLPAGGTVNRVNALAMSAGRLYVAGGDAGLLAFDTSVFVPPYPLRSYGGGATNSIASTALTVFAAPSSGGLTYFARNNSGRLVKTRHWADGQMHFVHDANGSFLLSSSGATLSYWAVSSSAATLVSSATFAAPIKSALLSGDAAALALLNDGTMWTIDLAQLSPPPVRLTAVASSTFIARSARGIAVAQIKTDGTTDVLYFPAGNFNTTPSTASIPGAATALALGDSRAAIFTFRGISVIDFEQTPPNVRLLPQSNTSFVTSIGISGNRLIDLAATVARVWDLNANRLERQFSLPATGAQLHVPFDLPYADIATSAGVTTLDLVTSSQQPVGTGNRSGNDYYRKAAASTDRLYLFDGASVDAFATNVSAAPGFLTSVGGAGTLDSAASDSTIFTLSSSGALSSFSPAGTPMATATLNEGPDAVPLSVKAVRGAAWVSISRGCLTTGCEKKTIIFDSQSLVRTASLSGAVVDVTGQGTRAYAIFETPNEIRAYDVSDPLHPSQVASRASEGGASALAWNGGTVYVLGDKLYAYSDSTLAKISEQLSAVIPSAATHIAIDGGCAIITGRSSNAEAYALNGTSAMFARTLELPANGKGVVTQPGRILILTDYSIEVWSRGAGPTPPRRRVAP